MKRVHIWAVCLAAMLMVPGVRPVGLTLDDVPAIVLAAENDAMNALAERYVKLVLALGQHDADYVDAYYGPPEWRKQAEATKPPLDQIDRDAASLAAVAWRRGVLVLQPKSWCAFAIRI